MRKHPGTAVVFAAALSLWVVSNAALAGPGPASQREGESLAMLEEALRTEEPLAARAQFDRLVERVRADEVWPEESAGMVARLLDLQRDGEGDFHHPSRVFQALAERGHVTTAQMERFWRQMWRFELVTPEAVEAGRSMAFLVRGRCRGAPVMPTPEKPISGNWRFGMFEVGSVTRIRLVGLRLDGEDVAPPPDGWGELPSASRGFGMVREENWGWGADSTMWERVVADPSWVGSARTIELDIKWFFGESGQWGLAFDPDEGWIKAEDWLRAKGVLAEGKATLRSEAPVVERGGAPIHHEGGEHWAAWLTTVLDGRLEIVVQPRGDLHVFPGLSRIPERLDRDPPVLFADAKIAHKGREYELLSEEKELKWVLDWALPLRDEAWWPEVFERASHDPDDWWLVLTPRPERAYNAADRPTAWSGDPIWLPLRVEIDDRREEAARQAPARSRQPL